MALPGIAKVTGFWAHPVQHSTAQHNLIKCIVVHFSTALY